MSINEHVVYDTYRVSHINGDVRWACQSCLKGHRVSGCTHVDRDLTLVPKKGRPVTQCQHCRQERKKRSAHVSCDCSNPQKLHHSKEKCIHLRESVDKGRTSCSDESSEDKDSSYLAAVSEEQGCCCKHGGGCSCASLKHERDDEDSGSVTPPRGPAVKPRLDTAKSDGHLTVFQNGHHKPVHRKNHLAHECGMPYKVPMQRANTDHHVATTARRSVDSLALDTNTTFDPSTFMPQNSTPFSGTRRLSKSEHPSPKWAGLDPSNDTGLSDAGMDLDFNNLVPIDSLQSADSYGFPPLDPLSGVAESTFDPWSAFPSAESLLMPNNNPFGVWPTHDNSGVQQPALTATSSGTQSEIDEIPPMDDAYAFGMPSIQEDPNFDFEGLVDSTVSSNRRSLPASFFSDFVVPPVIDDWQAHLENYTGEVDKLRTSRIGYEAFDDEWNNTTLPQQSNMAHRPLSGMPNMDRQALQSQGTPNPRNGDLIRQLFPDFDEGDATLPPGIKMPYNTSVVTRSPNTSPADVDFGLLDDESAFTARPWTDGSMSVPNDQFTTSAYDFGRDYSHPDFAANWSQ